MKRPEMERVIEGSGIRREELELHAEDTRSLKTTKESQGCGPEGQSQKQWVKNSCPDLPKHLDTKMVPQPLKESAVLTPRVPALPKTGSIGDWEVTAESQEALGPDRHAEKEFCMDPPGDNCGNGLSLGFEMRCEDEDRISEQDLFEDFPGALSKCTAGDDCYPHDWGEDSENENESKGQWGDPSHEQWEECSSEEDLEKLIDHQGLYLAEKPYKCDMKGVGSSEVTERHHLDIRSTDPLLSRQLSYSPKECKATRVLLCWRM
ncbi:hypothetical protein MJT46_001701 [Ovis ammon polii x Ovis aries]|nr:hypothetical protein MJT46_001701 [Ovis ammon polii x Ovis aries]